MKTITITQSVLIGTKHIEVLETMTMHRVEFDYDLPEGGSMELDIDPSLDAISMDAVAHLAIQDSFPEAINIAIIDIEELK